MKTALVAAAVLVLAGCGSRPPTQGTEPTSQGTEPTTGVIQTTGILKHQRALVAQEHDLLARWKATQDPDKKKDIRHQFCDTFLDLDPVPPDLWSDGVTQMWC